MDLKLNSLLRAEARASLNGYWSEAVLGSFLYLLIICCFQLPSGFSVHSAHSVFGSTWSILGLLISLPLSYGLAILFLQLFRGDKYNPLRKLFSGFNDFGRVFTTNLLLNIYVALWTLLLIVPGIIKYYSYALTNFILLDNPELKNNDAIELSMKLMNGKKMKLFMLDLSFIGWLLLSIVTFGIGLLWLIPYIQTTRAAFYEDIKSNIEIEVVID